MAVPGTSYSYGLPNTGYEAVAYVACHELANGTAF